jgi:hypothetical protein
MGSTSQKKKISRLLAVLTSNYSLPKWQGPRPGCHFGSPSLVGNDIVSRGSVSTHNPLFAFFKAIEPLHNLKL